MSACTQVDQRCVLTTKTVPTFVHQAVGSSEHHGHLACPALADSRIKTNNRRQGTSSIDHRPQSFPQSTHLREPNRRPQNRTPTHPPVNPQQSRSPHARTHALTQPQEDRPRNRSTATRRRRRRRRWRIDPTRGEATTAETPA
ncbi:hypothetical protein BS78_02G086000 [Paspalum vaginatum]|nr:hypothetical protein BS78_02G086000 [Paspalum vaginatum]